MPLPPSIRPFSLAPVGRAYLFARPPSLFFASVSRTVRMHVLPSLSPLWRRGGLVPPLLGRWPSGGLCPPPPAPPGCGRALGPASRWALLAGGGCGPGACAAPLLGPPALARPAARGASAPPGSFLPSVSHDRREGSRAPSVGSVRNCVIPRTEPFGRFAGVSLSLWARSWLQCPSTRRTPWRTQRRPSSLEGRRALSAPLGV